MTKTIKRIRAPYVQGDVDLSDKEAVEAADRSRFAFVNDIVSEVENRKVLTRERNFGDKIDAALTNKWLGIPIFALVMWAVFWISQSGPAVWLADWLSGVLTAGQSLVADAIGSDSIWASMLVDGIIGGVIAVIGFLPLVMVMYFLIALLEDCGYMARATVVLDPIFKKVGLSGKSAIPFVIGTGCAVPGVMACRTIHNERERRATALLAPFMPCGAKLPVIALFAGVFFPGSRWVGVTMYFAGILIILLCALLVNAITGNRSKRSYFIIELPEYKGPSIKRAFLSMCQRGRSYIVKAGTVILVCNFIVHVMQNFSWHFAPVEDASESILATVASPFALLFAPIIGYVSWQMAAATITGFIAKENVVGTLAVCFSISNLISLDFENGFKDGATSEELLSIMNKLGEGSGAAMLSASALAFLMFNLFSPPCFAAIGAMSAELKSKKWLLAGIGLQFSVGYTVGFLTYFFAVLFTSASFGSLWMPILGWSILAVIATVLTVLIIRQSNRLKAENALAAKKKETIGV